MILDINVIQSVTNVDQENTVMEPIVEIHSSSSLEAVGTSRFDSSTISRPPTQSEINEFGENPFNQSSTNYSQTRPKPIRSRKRKEFPGSGKHIRKNFFIFFFNSRLKFYKMYE